MSIASRVQCCKCGRVLMYCNCEGGPSLYATPMQMLEKETAELRAQLVACEEQRDALRELLHDIMGNIGEMGPSGPCPVCWTYTHKGWCWYEKARALRGAGE